jgi:O-antigen/teichoic acid export membrane protein
VALAVSPLFGEKWWIVAVPALVTPFLLLTVYQEGLCRGIGHVRAVNLIRIGNAVMPLLFITPPLLAGASPRTAIEIWALAYVVMPLLTYLWLRRFLGPPRLPSDRAFYRRVVTYGVKISGLNAMDTAHWRIGLLALAVVASDAAVGVYSIALAGLGVLFIATQALDLSTFRRIGSDLPEASAALTARTVRHATLITLIGGVILVPVTFLAIPWTVGKGYDDVPILLVMLIPCAICESATNPVYTYFQVQATKPGTLLKVAGSAFLTNVGLTVALAPRWGIWGVAAAASLAGMVQIGVAQRVFRTEANVRFRDMLPGRPEVGDYLALATRMRGRLSRGASSGGGE